MTDVPANPESVEPSDPDEPHKYRRPWLAALLSLLWPGVGHVYATDIRRGFKIYGVLIALITALMLLFCVMAPTSVTRLAFIVGYIPIALVFSLYCAIDAFRAARRAGVAVLSRYNRVWFYLSMVAIVTVFGAFARPHLIWKSYSIGSESMLPTIHIGEWIMSWRGYYRDHEPKRGEIAIFEIPHENGIVYVKRIVGVPGDRIQLRRGRLFINGAEMERRENGDFVDSLGGRMRRYSEIFADRNSHEIIVMDDDSRMENTPVFTVPPDHVFFLGDSRDRSEDSRFLSKVGYVPRSNLVGRVTLIYWSSDFSRIGLKPE